MDKNQKYPKSRRKFLLTTAALIGGSAIGTFFIPSLFRNKPARPITEHVTTDTAADSGCRYNLETLAGDESPLHLTLPDDAGSVGGRDQPVLLTWPNDDDEVLVHNRNNECYITYNGKKIIRWDPPKNRKEGAKNYLRNDEGPFIYGASAADLASGYKAIPLSVPAIRDHPLHYRHRYTTVESYGWLDDYLPADADLTLTPPPQDVDKNSYQYRKWAYDNALRTSRRMLDWQPDSGLVPPYEKKHNLFPLALARMESGDHELPGPNLWIVNKLGYSGAFQQKENVSLPITPFTTKKGKWRNYEVAGKPVSSRDDFLGNLDAQMLALMYQLRSMHRSLAGLNALHSRKYTRSGIYGAAHLGGPGAAARLVHKGKASHDGTTGATTRFYAQHFSGLDEGMYPFDKLKLDKDTGLITGLGVSAPDSQPDDPEKPTPFQDRLKHRPDSGQLRRH